MIVSMEPTPKHVADAIKAHIAKFTAMKIAQGPQACRDHIESLKYVR